MSEIDWKWKIGIIAHLGERAFQQLGDKIRYITQLMGTPDGRIIYGKCLLNIAGQDPHIQHEASGFVIMAEDIKEEFHADLNRVWNGGVIVPVNGGMRLPK